MQEAHALPREHKHEMQGRGKIAFGLATSVLRRQRILLIFSIDPSSRTIKQPPYSYMVRRKRRLSYCSRSGPSMNSLSTCFPTCRALDSGESTCMASATGVLFDQSCGFLGGTEITELGTESESYQKSSVIRSWTCTRRTTGIVEHEPGCKVSHSRIPRDEMFRNLCKSASYRRSRRETMAAD